LSHSGGQGPRKPERVCLACLSCAEQARLSPPVFVRMPTSALQLPDGRIFDWLGLDAKRVPYYLHPLNLMWSDEGVEHDLEIFRRAANLLAADPPYWAEILRSASWRHCLAGCTCLLVSRRHEYYEELCSRFRAGSFVAPQIAVTLGLLHGTPARSFFLSALDEPAIRRSGKQAMSAYQILLRLGAHPGQDLSVDSWTVVDHDDALIAEQVANLHWSFWSSRV
jgi:hypothetical protein